MVNIRSNSHAGHRDSTFFNLSHAIVRDLYSRHGKDLDFAGVVIYPMASDDLATKERMAEYATKLARILGAEGAISSYAGGGHPAVEFMLICQKCEQEGIKTVLVMPEAYGTPEDPGFVYSVPRGGGHYEHRQRDPKSRVTRHGNSTGRGLILRPGRYSLAEFACTVPLCLRIHDKYRLCKAGRERVLVWCIRSSAVNKWVLYANPFLRFEQESGFLSFRKPSNNVVDYGYRILAG